MPSPTPSLALLALALAAPSVFAQAPSQSLSSEAPANKPRDRAPSATFSAYLEHNFASDFDNAPGEVSVTRLIGDLGVSLPVFTDSTVVLSLGTEYDWYNFENATAFAPGFSEPWGNVVRYRLDAMLRQRIDDKWRWFVGGDLQSAGEPGADWNKTLTFGGRAGVSYAFFDNFTLGGGAFVHTRLEDDVFALPYLFIDYKITDQWSIRTTGRNPANFGFGAELSFKASDSWTLFAAVAYQARDFRLDEDGASPKGVGQDRRVPVSIGVEWKANDTVSLLGYVGFNLLQEFELQDPNGNELKQIDAKASPFLGIQAQFRF